jgi:fumarylacetoacetase
MSPIKSWLQISPKSHFSLANIPFGIISTPTDSEKRVPAVAIGDYVLDLKTFSQGGGFSGLPSITQHIPAFASTTLNAFAALGRPVHRQVRQYLQDIFKDDTQYPDLLKENDGLRKTALIPRSAVVNHLPLDIGDYTDFFAGRNHAFNVGTLFRGPDNALQPNYNHIPVAYHGRASSVVVSGTSIRRPWGQILTDPKADPKIPTFTSCRRLDIELEMAMFVCAGNELGKPVPIAEAESHIFGYALMNDWSARDIQTWEYVPLGPFNAKNFGTSISPWIVLADALEPFRTRGLENDTKLQAYLQESREDNVFDIDLEVELKSESSISSSRCCTN